MHPDEAEVVTDREGRIVGWNEGARRLYGYEPREVLGRTIWLLTPTARSADVATAWARVLTGERLEYEVDHLAKGGRRVRVKGVAEPERDEEGRVVGVRGRMREGERR